MTDIKVWINAARPRTWPTSVSPVLAGNSPGMAHEKALGIAAIVFFSLCWPKLPRTSGTTISTTVKAVIKPTV